VLLAVAVYCVIIEATAQGFSIGSIDNFVV
jgi:hypothetical protein